MLALEPRRNVFQAIQPRSQRHLRPAPPAGAKLWLDSPERHPAKQLHQKGSVWWLRINAHPVTQKLERHKSSRELS